MKKLFGLIPLFASIPICAYAYNLNNLDNLATYKKIDIDFDNNKIINIVTNKEYSSINKKYKLVTSLKGNGFNSNNDYFTIPFSDAGIDSNKDLTVSFLFRWGGQDNIFPMTTNTIGLWIKDNKIGFNTGNGVLYGVENPFKPGEIVSISATMDNSNPRNSKLYINGKRQSLKDFGSTSMSNKMDGLGDKICLGGYNGMNDYTPKDETMIDEIKIYQKNISDTEANEIANSHKIPTLRGEVENNSYVKLFWATEILPKNVLWSSSFEDNDELPYFETRANSPDGHQSITTEDSYSGTKSIKVGRTFDGNGSAWWYPSTKADYSEFIFNKNRKMFKGGTKLSASIRVKTNKGEKIRIAGRGGQGTYAKTAKEFFKLNKELTFPEGVKKGQTTVRVDGLEQFKSEKPLYHYWIADRETKPENYYKEWYEIAMVTDADLKNKTITFNKGFPSDIAKGEPVRIHQYFNPVNFPMTNLVANGEWNLYNSNTEVSSWDNYDTFKRGFLATLDEWSVDKMYIDDFKFGLATKVKLYRDDNKIYEGYDSEFKDTLATDKTNPNKVKDIKTKWEFIDNNNVKRKLSFNFDEVIDNGTTYKYNISSVDSEGVESPKSESIFKQVTSGIKGYSYVIDKIPNTVPDNIIDTTNTSIDKNIDDNGEYFIHIKAIDKAGNNSEVTHVKLDIPALTAKPVNDKNYIRLDWNMNNIKDKIFKVYQQKEGSTEFQSISLTNFDNKKQVKVLNIYPYASKKLPTFKTWDGEIVDDLCKSASLKYWMEAPNSENEKGYGKGLIEVTPVSISDFNKNPEEYLSKDYNVIMFGSYDSNSNQDLTDNTINPIKKFVKSGKGILFGHDTLRAEVAPNFSKLRDLVNIEYPGDTNIPLKYLNDDYAVISNVIRKEKNGLLTNYPWIINKNKLSIPKTHSSLQWAKGDIWFDFTDFDKKDIYKSYIYNGIENNSSNNFYLTTFNNTAMIQTGHSNGEGTPDEQKILANTLFYLNQLSENNYLDDHSGQDVKAPDKPNIYEHKFSNDGYLTFKFNPVNDNGSKYKYYVESKDKEDISTISNISEATITTGVKGYSYVIDDKPNTVPDNVIEQSDNKDIKYRFSDKDVYIHIKSIDNAGNSSEVLHYKVSDRISPVLKLELDKTNWTNKEVTIKATAVDKESGIKQIILPNGNVINSDTATFTVTKNGIYYFKAIDLMNNIKTESIIVSNIDNGKPEISISNNQSWTNKDVDINITAIDN